MELHPDYGLVFPEEQWVPSPNYLLRRARILELTQNWSPDFLVEVGSGAGALLVDFANRGFLCTGIERSQSALKLARRLETPYGIEFQEGEPQFVKKFRYLIACEVLEHIEDDYGALVEWSSWLKPKADVLVSVPAHPSKWGPTNEWAGHVRRYKREHLTHLFERAGFEVNRIECYGFPLSNALAPIRSFVHGRQLKKIQQSQAAKTEESGVRRGVETLAFPIYQGPIGRKGFRVFNEIQKRFLDSERGMGYICLATKK